MNFLIKSLRLLDVRTTLVPNGTAYAIDPLVASKMLLRRDVTVEDWSAPKADQYGIKATTRFGLGILRSNAIAKMSNIKTHPLRLISLNFFRKL